MLGAILQLQTPANYIQRLAVDSSMLESFVLPDAAWIWILLPYLVLDHTLRLLAVLVAVAGGLSLSFPSCLHARTPWEASIAFIVEFFFV